MRHLRVARIVVACALASFAIAGCSNDTVHLSPQPTTTPGNQNPPSSGNSVPFTAGTAQSAAAPSGFTATFTVPTGSTAPAGTNLAAAFTTSAPAGAPTVAALRDHFKRRHFVGTPTAFGFFTVTPTAAVSFNGLPSLTVALPTSVTVPSGNYYAAVFTAQIGTTGQFVDAGTVHVTPGLSGMSTTVTFSGGGPAFTVASGAPLILALYATPSLALKLATDAAGMTPVGTSGVSLTALTGTGSSTTLTIDDVGCGPFSVTSANTAVATVTLGNATCAYGLGPKQTVTINAVAAGSSELQVGDGTYGTQTTIAVNITPIGGNSPNLYIADPASAAIDVIPVSAISALPSSPVAPTSTIATTSQGLPLAVTFDNGTPAKLYASFIIPDPNNTGNAGVGLGSLTKIFACPPTGSTFACGGTPLLTAMPSSLLSTTGEIAGTGLAYDPATSDLVFAKSEAGYGGPSNTLDGTLEHVNSSTGAELTPPIDRIATNPFGGANTSQLAPSFGTVAVNASGTVAVAVPDASEGVTQGSPGGIITCTSGGSCANTFGTLVQPRAVAFDTAGANIYGTSADMSGQPIPNYFTCTPPYSSCAATPLTDFRYYIATGIAVDATNIYVALAPDGTVTTPAIAVIPIASPSTPRLVLLGGGIKTPAGMTIH